MPSAVPLSVVVITKNEEGRLADCLGSAAWAGEIVIVDDESSDRTVEIAKRYTDRIFQRRMDIEGRHRNFAYAQARHPWVLSLDADERVTEALQEEIVQLLRGQPSCAGYTVPRRNYIGSRWVRHGGWYPSPQLKLFRKEKFRYEESEVHPRAFMEGDCGSLKEDLIHYSYRDLADFLAKLNRQTTLEAIKWVKDQRKMRLSRGLWRTFDRFRRTLWVKKSYRDGMLGYLVAVYAGLYQFLSYAKYWHLKNSLVAAGPAAGCTPPSSNMPHPFPKQKQVDGDEELRATGRTPASPAASRAALSAVLLTKDAEKTLPACLESLQWVDEIILVDGGSRDSTVELGRLAGAKIITDERSDDFGGLRNAGTDAAKGDWILQLDADEVVTPEFRKELERILRRGVIPAQAGINPKDPRFRGDDVVAYKFRRRNRFLGHWMRFGGWDHFSLHLFRKGQARYRGRVHEKLLVNGTTGVLRAGVEHTPFRSLEEFVERQNRYTSLEALELWEKNPHPDRRELRYQMVVRPLKLFWKMYVKKQGFRDGTCGLIFSGLFGFVHLIQWAKYWELSQTAVPRVPAVQGERVEP